MWLYIHNSDSFSRTLTAPLTVTLKMSDTAASHKSKKPQLFRTHLLTLIWCKLQKYFLSGPGQKCDTFISFYFATGLNRWEMAEKRLQISNFWKPSVGQGHFKFMAQSERGHCLCKIFGRWRQCDLCVPYISTGTQAFVILKCETLGFDATCIFTSSFSLGHKLLNTTKLLSSLSNNVLESLLTQGLVLKLSTEGTSWEELIQCWHQNSQHPWSSAI